MFAVLAYFIIGAVFSLILGSASASILIEDELEANRRRRVMTIDEENEYELT